MEFWADTAETKIIYDYMYKGIIKKIEDNKIYFLVDKESRSGSHFCEDVKDYQIVFDIDTYDLESDPYVGYSVNDFLIFDFKHYYNANELEFLVGEYLRVCNIMGRDSHTAKICKDLVFLLTLGGTCV